ncbi:MAG: T9SS type A sorting domain-containing protein [Chitinophagales bacterium]|nr:T9SS type A sorting domain-containing protein [Chitinophagales bacterium]
MMKTNFTHPRLLARLAMILLLGIFTSIGVEAQSCSCKGSIQISLDETGEATVTVADLLADNSTCSGTQQVFVMETMNGAPIPTSPKVNCTHIGKTLFGKVTNGTNSCWTTITVEDKLDPVIECPTGIITLTCVELSDFVPNVTDNCGVLKLDTIKRTIIDNKNCNVGLPPNVICREIREYQATDLSGNKSNVCTVTFDVTTIDFADIDLPDNFIGVNSLSCDGEDWAKLDNGNPSPYSKNGKFGTGYPSIGGVDLHDNADLFCNLVVSYTDVKLPTVKCVTKIMRTWTFFEWSCLNRDSWNHTQMIEIVDNEGPTISGLEDFSASTSNNVCEAKITLPAPTLSDNCDGASLLSYTITVYLNGGTVPGPFVNFGQSRLVSLPVGVHKVVYTAYDGCKNSNEYEITITVFDKTPPVAICDEYDTVGLTSDGTAWVPASSFDDGSYDECSLFDFAVKRMNPNTCGGCEIPVLTGFTYLGDYTVAGKTHYYYLSKDKRTPLAAYKTAKAFEANVVTYNTLAEADWVKTQAYSKLPTAFTDPILIGLNDITNEDTFVWQSGEKPNYAYPWAPGQPNGSGDYVVQGKDGLWNDVDSDSDYFYYVMEIEDPCGFSSYAKFCCADIPQNQMVVFRVIDESGNYNDCMVSAIIQDKIGPTIECPADTTIDCEVVYDVDNLGALFGDAVAYDNCQTLDIEEKVDVKISSCRVGYITRTFTVTDAGGRTASCTQTITVQSLYQYEGPTAFEWPGDTTINSCGDPNDPNLSPDVLGRPILSNGPCALVGAEYSDKVYTFNNSTSPACFKIMRTWTVIDWCQPITETRGYRTWTHTQIIMATDNVAPVFEPLVAEVSADTYDALCANGTITLTATASDNCTQVLRKSYKIDLDNDGTFDISPNATDGNTISITDAFPVGKHRIVYTFEDKCGNITSREQIFSIVNRKAPGGILIKGLSINLMKIGVGQGMAEVWASDFIKEASHPCGYDVVYSFEEITFGPTGKLEIVPNLVFSCDDLGVQEVIIWIASVTPAGDIVQTYITTFIDVQDNNNVCDPDGRRVVVSGNIATEANDMLEDASVDLIGSEFHQITGKDGAFNFNNMPTGGQYYVSPAKNDDALNGVSTFDLVMIQRHILGIEALASPYKQVAADANRDGKITASDLSDIRKLILGVNDNFTNNTSWRFIDKNYQFADKSNAQGEAFPEVYHIDRLNTDMKTDFIAVKTGDVSGDVQANRFTNITETRSNSQLILSTNNTSFDLGQTITVPVKVADVAKISGMQFTLGFDNELVTLVGINPGALNVNDSNFGLNDIHNGLLAVSWNTGAPIQLDANTTLFTITFVTRDQGNAGNLFQVNSDIVRSEAYDANDDKMDVAWRSNNTKEGFELFQNTPNPFKQTTSIQFNLPEAMSAQVTVNDITGKVVKTWNVQGVKGLNTVEFNHSNLPSGVLYYSIQAGEFVATKKMIVIE